MLLLTKIRCARNGSDSQTLDTARDQLSFRQLSKIKLQVPCVIRLPDINQYALKPCFRTCGWRCCLEIIHGPPTILLTPVGCDSSRYILSLSCPVRVTLHYRLQNSCRLRSPITTFVADLAQIIGYNFIYKWHVFAPLSYFVSTSSEAK
jgi:hypothetical protein